MISRKQALEAISDGEFEVAVVGGGATGAMVALDAASRGYSVALVERGDYAEGTSSRSSKMIHGGLRYLRNFDIGLVREALLERSLMARLAPHLVYPTPYLVPSFGDERRDLAIGVGLNAYDVMARARNGSGAEGQATGSGTDQAWSPERHRTIDGAEAARLMPALAPLDPREAYLFYDCQTDDSRLVLTALGEAERYGAVLVNGVEAVSLLERDGRAVGVMAREAESGEEFELRARHVVNATGVWADRLRPGEILEEEEVPHIAPSRGTHLTLSVEDLPVGEAACIIPAGADRTIFALPWFGRALVGTTDNDYDGDIDRVTPGGGDVEYLLDAVNAFFGLSLGPEHVTGAFAGVRPLISSGDPKKSVDISRRAELYETSSGMLTITGGKLTTWRRMGEQTVDRIVEREGREAPCRTAEIPLGMPADPDDLASGGVELPDGAVEHLASRYGQGARRVIGLCEADPRLAAPILDGFPDLLAEAALAAREEQARTVADVLLRRTRLGILDARRLDTAEAVAPVAEAMGEELGWSAARREEEARRWPVDARREGLDPTAALT